MVTLSRINRHNQARHALTQGTHFNFSRAELNEAGTQRIAQRNALRGPQQQPYRNYTRQSRLPKTISQLVAYNCLRLAKKASLAPRIDVASALECHCRNAERASLPGVEKAAPFQAPPQRSANLGAMAEALAFDVCSERRIAFAIDRCGVAPLRYLPAPDARVGSAAAALGD